MEIIKENNTAETFKLIANWEFQSKLLKANFPQLTDADLQLDHGQEEELLLRLETKIGLTREDLVKILIIGM